MKTSLKILRGLLVAVLIIAVGLPTICYVMLSTDWAQERMRTSAQVMLTRVLGTEVQIGGVAFSPFNRLHLTDLSVEDDYGQEALQVKSVDLRIELAELLRTGRMVIDYAVLDDIRVNLYKSTPEAPLNISDIIKRLKSDKPDNGPSIYDIGLNDLEIINGTLDFNVQSEPETPGVFNPNHISIAKLDVKVNAPHISNHEFVVRLDALSFKEQSGLEVVDWESRLSLTDADIALKDFSLILPQSSLYLTNVEVPLNGLSSLAQIGRTIPVELGISPGSHLYLPDLKALVPELSKWELDLAIALNVEGTLSDMSISQLSIGDTSGYVTLDMSGSVYGLPKIDDLRLEDVDFDVVTHALAVNKLLNRYEGRVTPFVRTIIRGLGSVDAHGKVAGTMSHARCDVRLRSGSGTIDVKGDCQRSGNDYMIDADLKMQNFNLGHVLGQSQLGMATLTAQVDGTIGPKKYLGNAKCSIEELEYKGYAYHDIDLDLTNEEMTSYLNLDSRDPNARVTVMANYYHNASGVKSGVLRADVQAVNPDTLNLYKTYPGHILSAQINGIATRYKNNSTEAALSIYNLRYLNRQKQGLKLKRFVAEYKDNEHFDMASISSDILNGSVEGKFDFATLGRSIQCIVYEIFPSIAPDNYDSESYARNAMHGANELAYDFTIDNAEGVCKFFKLPVSILDPVNIYGDFSGERQQFTLNLDADWLLQGDKLVTDTYLSAVVNGRKREANVFLSSHYPTKKGPMNLMADIQASNGDFATLIDWELERDIPINGKIQFNTDLERASDGKLYVGVKFLPGQINFGGEIWTIKPSTIIYSNKLVEIEDFTLTAPTQSVKINGVAGPNDYDQLTVRIDNVALIEIFETLEIDKAMLCGNASGVILASKLFSDAPIIQSKDFTVKGIGYNGCVIGDADLVVGFDNDQHAFYFNADVTGLDKRQSQIHGTITPATEELNFYFDANHVPVGFLKPFMEAFCSDIQGYATGNAHLYGNFKYIDLDGDIMADTVRLKIDFTNTWYSASTPLRITPGLINLDNITIYDEFGNRALLNGEVHHKYFKEPSFNFAITEAHNFLCYDITKADNPRWYGRIFGDGSAFVNGEPGVVNISVSMTTAPNSTFTFELLDDEEAEEYSFIVFRDATPVEIVADVTEQKVESKSEDRARALQTATETEVPTAYNLNITVNIEPQAQVNIVMDPIGGDCIRAHGSGTLTMAYGSVDQDLQMTGTYTLERGDYNFTLQNIIIKDFKIRRGSSITFKRDPYTAELNIDAIYSTNANLSDLDESFLTDKDLNRTNVPVYAVMKVTGNMQQPNIAFDLEFPTLTQDIYRKVKSIVSTDDMMNLQIIYLLALNRFYTPDYMSTTKGNELFSVASSTISSQLSSMLGKLSDNWSIAPNLRSDKGDFSDVEVDVALSSNLLNNRLLFNGNFGYRDKSLNTNQFVGDFDIEYLLDRSGVWRLKAYNRYNDQNYYVRSAQTTQGVGVVLRRDFDNILGFLRKKRLREEADSVKAKSEE